jgi:hypothetical protein
MRWAWLAVAGLVVALLVYIRVQQGRIADLQAAVDSHRASQADLGGGITRHEAEVVPAGGARAAAADAGVDTAPIDTDAKGRGASVTSTSVVTTKSTGRSDTELPSSTTVARPPTAVVPDGQAQCTYEKAKQVLRLSEPVGAVEVPLGEVGFSAWQPRPWSVTLLPRSYSVVTVGTTDDSGQHYAYSKFTVGVDGKTFALPVSTAKYVEDAPSAKWRWRVQPQLAVAVGGYAAVPLQGYFAPSLDVMAASYGQGAEKPEWKFLGVGIAYAPATSRVVASFVPVSWNLRRVLPWISNVYVGPSVGVDFVGRVDIAAELQVGL